MRCYKCNSVLTDNDYCLKCGADVSVYKIVVKSSNSYYNLGLAKAQVRDLTGAVSALKTSLKINKSNIKARNLLGLVYFEIGETALALKEWVISVNLKPDKNVATVYIKKVKFNPNKLEQLNQAAKKYNYALNKLQEGSDDVALIQLKKVVTLNPRFVRAQLLLGLLYMKHGNMDKAAKTIKKALETDRTNTLGLRYMDELNNEGIAAASKNDEVYYKPKKKGLSGNDVILPPNSYKEPSSGMLTVVQILFGVIIGVALVWFLVVPSKVQNAKRESNDTIKQYSESMSSQSVRITDLEKQLSEAKDELKTVKDELAGYAGDSGSVNMYAGLIDAVSYYLDDDFDNAMVELAKIDVTKLPTDKAKSLYTLLNENCNSGAETYLKAGSNAYDKSDYITAVKYLELSYKFTPESDEAIYYLAMSHFRLNENDKGKEYAGILKSKFGNSKFTGDITKYMEENNIT